jgi:hypothetical protein
MDGVRMSSKGTGTVLSVYVVETYSHKQTKETLQHTLAKTKALV